MNQDKAGTARALPRSSGCVGLKQDTKETERAGIETEAKERGHHMTSTVQHQASAQNLVVGTQGWRRLTEHLRCGL